MLPPPKKKTKNPRKKNNPHKFLNLTEIVTEYIRNHMHPQFIVGNKIIKKPLNFHNSAQKEKQILQ